MKCREVWGNIGQRNIQSVQNVLRQEGIRIVRQDVGANYARTLSMDVETGTVKVRSYGRPGDHLVRQVREGK